jgi:nucleotide-binding universal stress UspA family protein
MAGIIIGVDESDGAAAALRWGVAHATRHHEPVTAVLAWTFRDQHHLDAHAPFEPSYGHHEACRDLDAIVARALEGGGDDIGRRAVCGGAADALIDASADASLVVVGARGMGGFKGLLVGSVSREVLNRSHAPVAVVPELAVDTDGPVVVGIDGSPTSRLALAWALDEARATRSRLVAVHTWRLAGIGDAYASAHLAVGALLDGATRLLERELEQADTHGVEIESRLEEGSAAAALVEASTTASLVVVGSRGHRPLTGLVLGSVSDQVAHHARSTVVVVPPSAIVTADAR